MRAVSAGLGLGLGLAMLCGCNVLPPASLDSFVIGPQPGSQHVAMRERTSSRVDEEQDHELRYFSDSGVTRRLAAGDRPDPYDKRDDRHQAPKDRQ